jgi:hypothetical protein
MKMLQVWALGIWFCALGMAAPVAAAAPRETVEPSTIAILTVFATCFGMWLRSRAGRRTK